MNDFARHSNPRNILSYTLGTRFRGSEIKDWIRYNLDNKTSHTKVASCLKKYIGTLDDNNLYYLYKETYKSSENYNEYLIKHAVDD